MSFGSAKNMVRRMEGLAEWGRFKSVVLDLSDVPVVDGTAALAIEDMLRLMQAHRQHLFMVGIQPKVEKVLEGLGVLKLVRPGHRFTNRLDALHQAEAVAGAGACERTLAAGSRRLYDVLSRVDPVIVDADSDARLTGGTAPGSATRTLDGLEG
jgi:ABC-type transporter Mla MlaB component